MRKPLVSIIIPNYNKEKYIKEAIDSALNQTYKNIEVIVVDDGSTDGSKEIIKSYGNRIRAYFLPHRNANVCRNFGIKNSKGEYIQFLDSDDIISKDKIEKQIEVFKKIDAGIVGCWWKYLIEREEGIFIESEVQKPFISSDVVSCTILDKGWSPPNAYLFKKELVQSVSGFDENLNCVQDVDFIVNIAMKGIRFEIYPEVLAYYRRTLTLTTSQKDKKEFMLNCKRIADKALNYFIETGWTQERKKSILKAYNHLLRYYFVNDKKMFYECLRNLKLVVPRYIPLEHRWLRILSVIFGYKNAETIAYIYRKLKGKFI